MSAKKFQNTIFSILRAHGLEELFQHPEFCARLHLPGRQPLVIEHLAYRQAVSVAHITREEWSGDAIRDPEIVFQYTLTGEWWPVEIQQDPVGVYRAKFPSHDKVDVRFHNDVMPLVNMWNQDLKSSAWDTDAVTVELVGECKNAAHVTPDGRLELVEEVA